MVANNFHNHEKSTVNKVRWDLQLKSCDFIVLIIAVLFLPALHAVVLIRTALLACKLCGPPGRAKYPAQASAGALRSGLSIIFDIFIVFTREYLFRAMLENSQ